MRRRPPITITPQAWHRGEQTRIVLVFDVWHPDLTDREASPPSQLNTRR